MGLELFFNHLRYRLHQSWINFIKYIFYKNDEISQKEALNYKDERAREKEKEKGRRERENYIKAFLFYLYDTIREWKFHTTIH